ncbi:MAG: tetratricopeptide repeat protein [Planctomycetota bacterium]
MAEDEVLEGGDVQPEPAARGVRDLWQVPAMAVGLTLLAGGLYSGWVNRPLPDIRADLDRAGQLIDSGRYDAAFEVLNGRVRGFSSSDELFTDEVRARFHLLRARTIYLKQLADGIDVATNHERVLEEYEKHERLAGGVPVIDALRLSRTLLALGQRDEAWAASADAEPPAERVKIRRELVQWKLREDGYDDALAWLGDLQDERALTPDDEAWIAAREAEIRIARGYFDEAVARLLRAVPQLDSASDPARAELFLLLGEAYEADGDFRRADRQLERADELLPDSDALSARVLLAQAGLAQQKGNLDRARSRYDKIIELFGSSPSYLPALLGLAELSASAEEHGEAVRSYAKLVSEQLAVAPSMRTDPSRIWRAAIEQADGRLASGDVSTALSYIEVLQPLFAAVDEMPTSLLRLASAAHAERGDEIVSAAMSESTGLVDLADVDPVTRNTAREHYLDAASLSLNLADRVVLTDDAEYADAVWQAARAFDLAGDQDAAVRMLTRFVDGFPDHPNRAEGTFRLARGHFARGEYAKAAELYSGLVSEGSDGRPAGPGPSGAGLYSSLSYPPLARTYLLDSDPSNDANAEQLLLKVLRGGLGGPQSSIYLDALVEVSRLYYQSGRLPEAIERLEEAVELAADQQRVHSLRYRLADARRREAGRIDEKLIRDVPAPERAALEVKREEHLRLAVEQYDRVREGLGSLDPRLRRPLDELFLRNSYFFVADCEYDLGDRRGALARYTTARERYPEDPASLVAMMQIFNAYVAMGEYELAGTAGARARRFYESLDPAVWDDPLLPLSREDWERWLDASYEFAQANAGGG